MTDQMSRRGIASCAAFVMLAAGCGMSGTTMPPTASPTTPPTDSLQPTTSLSSTMGPATPAAAAIGRVSIDAIDNCELELDTQVTAGPFRLAASNDLPPDYAVAFDMFELVGDVAFGDFVADMEAIRTRLEAGEPYEGVASEGYPKYLTAVDQLELRRGETGELDGVLVPGIYVIECTVPVEQFGEFWPVDEVGPIEVRSLSTP